MIIEESCSDKIVYIDTSATPVKISWASTRPGASWYFLLAKVALALNVCRGEATKGTTHDPGGGK